MTIQFCSDLHLEFEANRRYIKENPIPPVGDLLLLAGDITLFSKISDQKDFFDYVSDNFEMTYWIPGNHEYYYSDINNRSGVFKENIRDNLILLNNCAIERAGVRFLFSTLWSRISPVNELHISRSLNDFQLVSCGKERLPVAVFNALHRDSVAFLSGELNKDWSGETVVVSHHVPTFENYPSRYKGDSLNEAFASDLSFLIEETRPTYWIYGHHHSNIPAFKIGVTNMLTNQVGYVDYDEHHSFSPGEHFDV